MRMVPVTAIAACDDDGRLLLVRRRVDGTWCLPGGHVDPGETWAQAVVREFREETGWDVRIDGLLGVYSDPRTQQHRYPSGDTVHLLGVVFLGTPIRQHADPDNAEISDLGWFAATELPEAIFGPDIQVIDDALTGHDTPVIA